MCSPKEEGQDSNLPCPSYLAIFSLRVESNYIANTKPSIELWLLSM